MINTYGNDYKLIIVGDATMSPYEIVLPDGANEHWNKGRFVAECENTYTIPSRRTVMFGVQHSPWKSAALPISIFILTALQLRNAATLTPAFGIHERRIYDTTRALLGATVKKVAR